MSPYALNVEVTWLPSVSERLWGEAGPVLEDFMEKHDNWEYL